MPSGTSFMEDYTLDINPAGNLVDQELPLRRLIIHSDGTKFLQIEHSQHLTSRAADGVKIQGVVVGLIRAILQPVFAGKAFLHEASSPSFGGRTATMSRH